MKNFLIWTTVTLVVFAIYLWAQWFISVPAEKDVPPPVSQVKITRRADVEEYFEMLGGNRQAVVVDYSGVDLLFRVEVTPHGKKTETVFGGHQRGIIAQGHSNAKDAAGKVSGRFVLTFGMEGASSYGDFELASSRLIEAEGESTSRRSGFRRRFFTDNNLEHSVGIDTQGVSGDITLQKGDELEYRLCQVTFRLSESSKDYKLKPVEAATVSVYCQPASMKSSQFDDPPEYPDRECVLGNSTTWQAVWPAGSTATPEQVSLMQKIVSIEPKGIYFNTLGVALYRAGQFEQAIKACQQSVQKSPGEMGLPGPYPSDFAFIAMSYHQLGNQALSREFKDKAVTAAQAEAFKNDPEIIAIIKELQTLIPASK